MASIVGTGSSLKAHWAYLRYLFRHKKYVLIAGLELGVPLWRLLVHDLSKLLPSEYFAYVSTFYDERGKTRYMPGHKFELAWRHHQRRNPHHWQYWLLTWDHGGTTALPMPETYIREMVADWMGAGRALGNPNTARWYEQNRTKMALHPDTRRRVEMLLFIYCKDAPWFDTYKEQEHA